MGVIERLNESADGIVRSVQLRTSNGRVIHPIVRLYLLEVSANDPAVSGKEKNEGHEQTTKDEYDCRLIRQAVVRGRQEWTQMLLAHQGCRGLISMVIVINYISIFRLLL